MSEPLPVAPTTRFITWSAVDDFGTEIAQIKRLIAGLYVMGEGMQLSHNGDAVTGIANALDEAMNGLDAKWNEALEKARVL